MCMVHLPPQHTLSVWMAQTAAEKYSAASLTHKRKVEPGVHRLISKSVVTHFLTVPTFPL